MSILSKIFGEPAPTPAPLRIHHPTLGELKWQDEGWWEGVWTVNGEFPLERAASKSLEFSVSGDRKGPSDTLVSALERTISRWPDVNQRLQHFLGSLEPRAASAATSLKPTAVSYLWPAKPDYFTVELALEGDEGAIWRVEFERGEPKHLSRDD
jgi:hypothetical protein